MKKHLPIWLLALATLAGLAVDADDLARGFTQPPDSARPWVYWFVMDGNFNRDGITADLEAMKRVGLGGVIFMEVDVGIPKGPVAFMSPPWRELFKHANAEAARLGLRITMPASPGWTGSGGPWVKPEQSMQKLVASETNLAGPRPFAGALPHPPTVAGFYRDVAVLAFPTPANAHRIEEIEEKAVFRRGHFSSEPGVKALIPSLADYTVLAPDQVVPRDCVVDLTDKLDASGTLTWDVPRGNWTVLRFGHTSTGANTRPAPQPGLGLECDKFDRAALEAHFDHFLGRLMADIGPLTGKSLVALHIDSWEMGPQNWSAKFPEEFQRRRGYDLRRYLPVMTGRVVDSLEESERFLWDLRQTILELIAENHAGYLAELAHRHALALSIEPYDGTPCDDMTYGARADVPMGEFWRDTFQTWFSCTEAASIAHVYGKPIVQAEAFTSGDGERWLAHPATLKALGDWAYCQGINRFVIHRYAHQPWLDRWPGMTMGPYGIHYERTSTWWEQSKGWVQYLSRCQFLLQQGLFVADICYLAPEASPQVFRPPATALRGEPPDRAGYNFDGCTPEALLTRMSVRAGRLVLPNGMSYRLLALPDVRTMTPRLLHKIKELVEAGATVVGPRPTKSPSLSGYPQCDREVQELAEALWGRGRVIADQTPEQVLARIGVPPDFEANHHLRYIHRRAGHTDIYFVANGESEAVRATCTFRVAGKLPEIWDPLTGRRQPASVFGPAHGRTDLPLAFAPNGSLFVVFRKPAPAENRFAAPSSPRDHGATAPPAMDLVGPWTVKFDPKWGGPESVEFPELVSWTQRTEGGIKFYSGAASYVKKFDVPSTLLRKGQRLALDLGKVQVMAEVKLNGHDLGILWTPPFRVDVTAAVKSKDNTLEIKVVNLWPNRLIGDASLPPDQRLTWTTWNPFTKDSPLLESGLLGPVTLSQDW